MDKTKTKNKNKPQLLFKFFKDQEMERILTTSNPLILKGVVIS